MDVYLSVLKSKECSKTFSGIFLNFIDTAISHTYEIINLLYLKLSYYLQNLSY